MIHPKDMMLEMEPQDITFQEVAADIGLEAVKKVLEGLTVWKVREFWRRHKREIFFYRREITLEESGGKYFFVGCS